jgi:carbamoyltransferase
MLVDAGIAHHRADPERIREGLTATLAAGKVVAVVRGRQEFGPRALGMRSVLASPSQGSVVRRLNASLRRSEFMPFAPIVRAERYTGVFDLATVPTDVSDCIPFMTICLPVHPCIAELCPAVVHVDGTARPQVVHREDDPFLHALLADFEAATGLPMLLNTSFNLHDEPIVSSAADAIAAFLIAELDVLLLEDCLVVLDENPTVRRLVELVRPPDGEVSRMRHAALNLSFGRQIFEGPGRYSDHAQ